MTVLALIVLIPISLWMLAALLPIGAHFAFDRDTPEQGNSVNGPIRSDYIGQTWFPQGDSIEITSVERSTNRVVVKGRYRLVSADKAGLTLHISQTNGAAIPADVTEAMSISRGRGDFELVDPNPFPGFLHVDISSDISGWPTASLYFGTRAEALAESKASWITNVLSASSPSIPSQLAQDGWQLWQAQKFSEAAAKFKQAVQLAPDQANAWTGLGWAEFNSGNSQDAEKNFQQAVSLDPSQPAALNGLGQIYLSQRKYDQAETYLLKAAPQAPAAWYGLTRLYLLQGKYEQAEKWAQDLIDSGQADDLVRQMLKAAQAKHLSAGLRFRIEPPPRSPNLNGLSTSEVHVSVGAGTNGAPLTYQWYYSTTNASVDPSTGLPINSGSTKSINPYTGLPVGSTNTGIIDPNTGLPVSTNGPVTVDPATGLPM